MSMISVSIRCLVPFTHYRTPSGAASSLTDPSEARRGARGIRSFILKRFPT